MKPAPHDHGMVHLLSPRGHYQMGMHSSKTFCLEPPLGAPVHPGGCSSLQSQHGRFRPHSPSPTFPISDYFCQVSKTLQLSRLSPPKNYSLSLPSSPKLLQLWSLLEAKSLCLLLLLLVVFVCWLGLSFNCEHSSTVHEGGGKVSLIYLRWDVWKEIYN